jgi:tetrahydromethanopterin S-methyltransferase subunit E
MKAYLIVTGTLFGLLAALHVWRMVVEWNGMQTEFWIVASGTVVAGVLSIWAWQLLSKLQRNQ